MGNNKETWVWLYREGVARYVVSSYGRVCVQKYRKNPDTKKLSPKGSPEELVRHIEPDGTPIVWIWCSNKNRPIPVADLVLEAFLGPKYLNGNKENCRLSNLGWAQNIARM